jgi:predicted  nucleic acid-binding Zn-ribbon protein
MGKMKREKIIAYSAVVLLMLALIGTGYYYSGNNSLSKNLNEEKLKTERMLSEKLALQKEIETYTNQINSLTGKNAELDKILAETNQKLSEKEAALNKIVRDNGNLKTLKKEIAELTQLKKEFEGQILALNETILKLNKEKSDLNQTIASLQDENKKLAANLDLLISMTSDNYLVEPTKKGFLSNKEKLTVVAKRTKKITVSFNVPENMVEDISFKITKPDGKQVDGKDNGIAYRVVDADQGLLASISGVGEISVSKKIEMTYTPKVKQKPGIYKIEMFNGEKYIGACNVKLR